MFLLHWVECRGEHLSKSHPIQKAVFEEMTPIFSGIVILAFIVGKSSAMAMTGMTGEICSSA